MRVAKNGVLIPCMARERVASRRDLPAAASLTGGRGEKVFFGEVEAIMPL